MKSKLIGIGKLSMGVLFACTGLAGANLLTNGDFETAGAGGDSDADGWFRTNTTIVQRWAEAGQPGHGDWMMLVQDNENAWHWASQSVAATPGLEYQASADFKTVMQPGEVSYIYMGWLDSGGAEIGNTFNTYTATDGDYGDWAWVSRSVAGVAPAGTAQVSVRVMAYADGGGNSAFFSDNVDLVTIPEPSTVGLFALMGGAMLWARKRFHA